MVRRTINFKRFPGRKIARFRIGAFRTFCLLLVRRLIGLCCLRSATNEYLNRTYRYYANKLEAITPQRNDVQELLSIQSVGFRLRFFFCNLHCIFGINYYDVLVYEEQFKCIARKFSDKNQFPHKQ